MPVYCLEGVGGSGKSLYLLDKFIIPFLKQGKKVYHNIEGLKVPYVALQADIPIGRVECLLKHIGLTSEIVDGEIVEKEDKNQIRFFYKDADGQILETGSLIVIDEAQNYFNSRDFKADYSRELIDYLSRNRHYKHTVVWATQNIEGVDITFRRQTQYIYWLERVGDKPYSICAIYEGWMKNEYTKPYDKTTFKFNQKLFGCYDSYIKGSEDDEEHRQTTNRWLHNKPLMIIVILFVCFVAFAISRGDPREKVNSLKNREQKLNSVSSPPAPPPDLKDRKVEVSEEGAILEGPSNSNRCFTQKYISNGLEYLVLKSGKVIINNNEVKECD